MDGAAHKLACVDFGIPEGADGAYRSLEPWHMTDSEGRYDLAFTPEIDRIDGINVAGIVTSNRHQVADALDGHVVLDDGDTLEIRALRGSAEHIHDDR